jgi:subtilisin-like proprotein convertase family protein
MTRRTSLIARIAVLGATLLAAGHASAVVVRTFDNATAGGIANPAQGCATPLTRTFVVSDSFTVSGIALGVNITHASRGQIQVTLVAPNGAVSGNLIATSADTGDNYDVMLSANGEGAINDGDTDPVAFPFFSRLAPVAAGTINFYTGNAQGTWTLRVCDNTAATNGTFNRARLVLFENTTPALSTCRSTLGFDWGSLGSVVPFTSTTVGGVTVSQGATSGESVNDGGTGIPSFVTRTTVNGNDTGYYSVTMDLTGDGELGGEFSTIQFSVPVVDLQTAVLDNDITTDAWEDYTRMSAAALTGGGTIPYVPTIGSASQAAGDWNEGDAAAAVNATTGNIGYAFLRSTQTLTVDYAQGDNPADEAAFQVIGIGDLQFCAFDYGDAPDSYDTLLGSGGARHVLGDRNLFLGAARPRGEADGSPGAGADLEGTEEDGVAGFTTYNAAGMTCGSYTTAPGEYCLVVNITNNTGATAQLVGWIDFNGDGDFDDPGERSLPRLGGGTGGAGDNTFTTGNIPNATAAQTVVMVWSGFGQPTNGATYARIRTSTDASFFGATPPNGGLASNGEVEDYPINAGTLPVTLAWVDARSSGGGVLVRWATASETGNIGFRVVEQADGRAQALHAGLVASRAVDATDVSRYSLQLARAPRDGTFWLEDVDYAGRATRHGPFKVDASTGREPQSTAPDWAAVRASIAPRRGSAATRAVVEVAERGFQRVRYEDLTAAGVDLGGASVDAIAVSVRGVAVQRRVVSADASFGPGDRIEFFGEPESSIYFKATPYVVAVDATRADPIGVDASAPGVPRGAWAWERSIHDPANQYSFSAPGDDPWYATRLLAYRGSPVSTTVALASDAVAQVEGVDAEAGVALNGVTAWPGGDDDHAWTVRVDAGPEVAGAGDGIAVFESAVNVPLSTLVDGQAQLAVGVTGGTPYDFDVMNLDRAWLRYPRLPAARGGRWLADDVLTAQVPLNADLSPTPGAPTDAILRAGFESDDEQSAQPASIRVAALPSSGNVAYRRRDGRWEHLSDLREAPAGAGYAAWVAPPTGPGETYWVGGDAGFGQPAVRAMPTTAALPSGNADYLVVTHPSLREALSPLLARNLQRGLSTAVVDLDQVFDGRAHGFREPAAIAALVREFAATRRTRYVLLVGADSYDYRDDLGLGAVSLLPTFYAPTGAVMRWMPADARFADVDEDGLPDLALGRMPARTPAELSAMLAKSLAYETAAPGATQLVVAGGGGVSAPFRSVADAFVDVTPGTRPVSRAYVDTLGAAGARQAVLDGFAAGPGLVSFIGHSAPSQWTFDPILTSADVSSLPSTAVSPLVVQWGCWNTYFVSPTADTLSQALLLAPDRGAAAVFGAVGLSDGSSHEALGLELAARLAPGVRIGDAVRDAQRALGLREPGRLDVMLGTALLGDPALPVR